MSQKQESENIYLQLSKAEHVTLWGRAKRAIAEDKGTEPDDLSRPQVFEELAEEYLDGSESEAYRQFRRLEDDMRVEEARAVVASDHGMAKDEISLIELLKITAGAYCGYQQTSDWRPSNPETVGFKEEIGTDGGKK